MNYLSIRIEGAILSPDILARIEDAPGQKPSDFGFESSTKVKDEIARAWADAQDYWRIFHPSWRRSGPIHPRPRKRASNGPFPCWECWDISSNIRRAASN
jgi:hypothetical protein